MCLVWLDCNVLRHLHDRRLLEPLLRRLQAQGYSCGTIRRVVRREAPDALRRRLRELVGDELLSVVEDPDRSSLSRKARKRRRKIRRAAKDLQTSRVDEQLLFLAESHEGYLVTDDRLLGRLTAERGRADLHDLLDALDLLAGVGEISEEDRETLLRRHPGSEPVDDLAARSEDRGGVDRFTCLGTSREEDSPPT